MAETDKILFPCKDSFQFPIGYILMSASKINPATFLKYGEWALLGSGRTILGAGDTDNGKETGGSFSKILTEANIPAHTHSLPSHTHQIPEHNHTASSGNNGGHVHSIGSGGNHSHAPGNSSADRYLQSKSSMTSIAKVGLNSSSGRWSFVAEASADKNSAMLASATTASGGSHSHSINSSGAHNHTITVANKAAFNTSNGGGGSSESVGSGTAFDITPSYIKLFIWERIK